MPLREYQKEIINNVKNAYRKGKTAPCIVLPCGGGKSVIVAEIAKKTTAKGNRVLFIVHRKELCDQIFKTFREWGVNMSLCTIGMVQTVCRHIDKIKPPALIITDENHHSKASSYMTIYKAFPKAHRVGVTATPVRLDGSGLADVNDELIIGVDAKWLIDNHYLAPYDYYAPSLVDLTGIKTVRGDFDSKSAEKIMLKKAIFGDVIANYKKLADGKQAVCYCVSVNHSIAMAEAFNAAGIDARHIDGETPKPERDKIIEMFRSGQIDILCNVDLISEGFDVPDCECAILLRPTKSLTLYIQQSMRCMRYKEGKRAIIIDHVGNYARFGLPDANRTWTLVGKKKSSRKNKADDDEVQIKTCPECLKVFPPKDENGKYYQSCPFCGYILPKSSREVEEEKQAVLQKIEGFTLNYDSPDQCNSYAELLSYAERKGYKPGWAYYQARNRGMI
jgi:superfamily II DNA or RNA helicase